MRSVAGLGGTFPAEIYVHIKQQNKTHTDDTHDIYYQSTVRWKLVSRFSVVEVFKFVLPAYSVETFAAGRPGPVVRCPGSVLLTFLCGDFGQ